MSNDIEQVYHLNHSYYPRFCENIVNAMKHLLSEHKISYLNIESRVKDLSSIKEKIKRKNYLNPVDQVEDICGIRIICYYSSDIQKIKSIIKDEFDVISEEDKTLLLSEKEFGYRSNHFIVKINQQWASAPNYRKLENYKAEIQVRTILMHAWAEIEHKLNYKSEQQVPEPVRRKLYRLSAKFEEADDQFEDLKDTISSYISDIRNKIAKQKADISNLEFNLDTYQSYLELKKGDYLLVRYNTTRTFDHLLEMQFRFKELDLACEYAHSNGNEIIENFKVVNYFREDDKVDFIELLYFSLDVLYPNQRHDRHRSQKWIKALQLWQNRNS
jgi:ppGpp synthetase/RelA/SpoT-type nucleotidyltranferase